MVESLKGLVPSEMHKIIAAAAVIITFYFVGVIARFLINSLIKKAARKTPWKWDDAFVAVIKKWIPVWCMLAGLYLALGFWNLPAEAANVINKIFILVFGIILITAVTNLTTRLISLYSAEIEGMLPLTNLTQNMSKLLIIGLGSLMILNGLGISITPIITTLGIGGLAVALALQDTLSNLFAGFYMTIAKQIRIGDFIKLESGEEGYVLDIGWRATRIRMLPNNVVLVPILNSRSQS